MIEQAWEREDWGGHGLTLLWDRLERVSGSIKQWSKEVFGSVHNEIKRLRSQLPTTREAAMHSGCTREVQKNEEELHEIYEREEIMFRQCSRVEWLKAGDRNTRYYQNRASHMRHKNTI
jgi:hypothetical protein